MQSWVTGQMYYEYIALLKKIYISKFKNTSPSKTLFSTCMYLCVYIYIFQFLL